LKIVIISATRKSPIDFQKDTALGVSLRRLAHDPGFVARIATANTRGLSHVYNEEISAADDDSVLVFVHDDVWIDDYYMNQRIAEGLEHFDVIGIAGNRRRIPNQPSWCFVNTDWNWDDPTHLSGAWAHGPDPAGVVQYHGEAPATCELLDGVFLAAKKLSLSKHGVAFDPIFDFDFYDMDFCRTARLNGLKLGTWPICLTHQSPGTFGSERWHRNYQTYLAKWGS
jgi:protein O-GlcNAc transferase